MTDKKEKSFFVKISVDTADLDVAIEKANRLKEIMAEINSLCGSLEESEVLKQVL